MVCWLDNISSDDLVYDAATRRGQEKKVEKGIIHTLPHQFLGPPSAIISNCYAAKSSLVSLIYLSCQYLKRDLLNIK